ncbi:hypothetical protein GCM10023310_55530 [Paenibacillus vulneris]|uniref:Uncharacterized protein n=1 Tax=Paenibacillus vulneris TaxID=1133364 RepID=A0ABW3UX56_9BACL
MTRQSLLMKPLQATGSWSWRTPTGEGWQVYHNYLTIQQANRKHRAAAEVKSLHQPEKTGVILFRIG